MKTKSTFQKWLDGDLDIMEHILDTAEVHDAPREELKHQEKMIDQLIENRPQARTVRLAEQKSFRLFYNTVAVVSAVVLIGVLLFAISRLPLYGHDNPRADVVVERYVEKGLEETGAVNIVAGMILDYRAFDTLGESHVLFTALVCVLILLRVDKKNMRPGYEEYYCYADKKGYSGTAVYTKREPLSVSFGLDGEHNDEGRVITCEYDDFYFVCCYVPNAQDGLRRIDYRMEFEDAMRTYLKKLDSVKPVIYTGDLNVAHEEIDIKNAKANVGKAGFSDQERGKMTELLSSGFADSFRRLYPDLTGAYSWWSYRFHARENNAGWRIDYFIVSDRLMDRVRDSLIYSDVYGSDHCPVGLLLD